MASSWDQAWGPDPLAEEQVVGCEICGETIHHGEPCIKMDGLIFCSAPCALTDEVEA